MSYSGELPQHHKMEMCRCNVPFILVKRAENKANIHCGHCAELVYENTDVLFNHTIWCESGIAHWYQRDLHRLIHRCYTDLSDIELSIEELINA